MATVGDATYPTPSELLQIVLDAIVFAYTWQGLDPPNVLPESDHYNRAQAYADLIAIAIANNEISEAESNPLTATGQALILLAAIFGVVPRPAAPSAGTVTIAATATVTIPQGFTGTTPDGQAFKVVAAPGFPLTVAPGGQVQVVALSPGLASNEETGTKLGWSNAAIGNLGPSATVAAPGLVGGIDADNDDRLRARLLAKLSAPPVGGNATSIADWAEGATASVEAAFVFQGVRGGSSYDVAVTTPGGTRQLASPTLQVIRAAILANMPGFADLNVTSITPNGVDVIISLDLPLPAIASGPGGGVLDAAPWPQEIAKVTAYNAGTGVATVNSVAGPVVGQSIGYWNPNYIDPTTGLVTGILQEDNVATVGGSTDAWTITLVKGWTNSPLNTYLSADAVSLVAYGQAFAAGVALLGPGEKTALPELLPRGARQPSTQTGTWYPNLSHRLLDAIDSAYPEVLNIGYAATYAAGTSITQTSPNIPGTTADPPGVLVLNSLAFIYTSS